MSTPFFLRSLQNAANTPEYNKVGLISQSIKAFEKREVMQVLTHRECGRLRAAWQSLHE